MISVQDIDTCWRGPTILLHTQSDTAMTCIHHVQNSLQMMKDLPGHLEFATSIMGLEGNNAAAISLLEIQHE